ncbi:hypothetical protein QWI17_15720 [Gilvimarinus sp. SDUM040013]|uniref:Solute-binding protein family 3/N-terminal domain-containing protein n=1 Tax=Gilvimarinus gilvus TaxID=3058038 RepID=A0ABU4RZF4_9GAMM|nr:hypothetical protein [Gilvimarinus sp. SDUM040013]MDO3387289.1 hypothetical protein [Gilvimarinus sp. SDUM040013]MDX6848978.1 hypothetical protein [Gilvimarinus sp. SDUM040013]
MVTHQPHPYFAKLLTLVLDKTIDSHGPYQLREFSSAAEKERIRKLLHEGREISIIWSTTNPERESNLRAIPFALLKGLNEYRLLLIRKGEQARFATVENLADLRSFTAGSGTHWQDSRIFEANQLPIVTSVRWDNLFAMLEAGRFDYVARGAYEVWQELLRPDFQTFELEQRLMLHYQAPYYFFVNRDNIALAERVLAGLKLAVEDGSYDELFFSHPPFAKGWQAVHSSKRVLIKLASPLGPPVTPPE